MACGNLFSIIGILYVLIFILFLFQNNCRNIFLNINLPKQTSKLQIFVLKHYFRVYCEFLSITYKVFSS